MPGKPATQLLVLSYNISNEAMQHRSSGTAGPLGGQCTYVPGKHGLTICARNMAQHIDGMAKAANHPFALVGLQEATQNWVALRAEASTTLAQMTPVVNDKAEDQGKSGNWFKIYQVSFYDPAVFSKPRVINSFLGQTARSKPRGRPIQILIFDAEQLVFVNVHNDHSFVFEPSQGGSNLQDRLTQILTGELSAAELAAMAAYRVILTGDFNNAARFNHHGSKIAFAPGQDPDAPNSKVVGTLSWQPFTSGPTKPVHLSNPPLTCARADGDWTQDRGHKDSNRPGDFVFDSDSTPQPEVPANSVASTLCSDHRPVVALLP